MTNETTFENVQLLDRVFHIGLGWGSVTQYITNHGVVSSLRVSFDTGTKVWFSAQGQEGINPNHHLLQEVFPNQSLFWDEVKIVAPARPKVAPPVDTLLNIWTNPTQKWKRYSTGKFASDGRLLVFNDGATSKSATDFTKVFAVDNWEVV